MACRWQGAERCPIAICPQVLLHANHMYHPHCIDSIERPSTGGLDEYSVYGRRVAGGKADGKGD